MRESCIFYKSFYDSIKKLDPQDQVQIYNAIFEYQFNGKEIELDGICESIFTLIIPQLKANNKRYENGKKGGAPKGNQNATKKQPKINKKTTEKQPNVNVNDNVNDKYIVEQIIQYLNEKCKTKYKSTTNKTKSLIKARLNEGFTLDDLKKVVDIKTSEWLNTKMEQYLRPETLFGTKFESYLNQKHKESYEEMMARLRKEFENE